MFILGLLLGATITFLAMGYVYRKRRLYFEKLIKETEEAIEKGQKAIKNLIATPHEE